MVAKKPRKRYFYFWLQNGTDRRDDEPVRVWAYLQSEAREIILNNYRYKNRFWVGIGNPNVKEFRKDHQWKWGITTIK